ncbi:MULTISPECIES: SIR2 family protein [Pseudomonas]|uniref:SIR2 family protein n=1 Tax=Pseudomonas TaxID=286 RepID=UPI002361D480|nr:MULTISPECIES: SIR2 family protein [Pseudomonas]WJV25801.1 SIR2 family protein [Pseudomonas chlororaphis]
MIDPINSLAFSMHANKGVYALLLGSGISRAARIPTGWEITLELVRKAAALKKEQCEPDPAAWFQNKTGKQPDYSDLLDMVAKTPAERQQLLRSYWEPSEEEQEEGAKLPTRAHRAIADLVKLGYIRVLLTTNFDRLMELALHDVGIQPTVLSTTDQIEGALPLIHTTCTIIKIHGDYLDTRIRNTPEELALYPEEFKHLLDRVFDEFGLVVAGWSADWDVALRDALTRAPYRRFSTFWASRGEPSEKAKDIIARKGAMLVSIDDADTLFSTLSEQVKALEEFSRPHPLSTEAAVATLKKYLSEPKYRIALDDLVAREVESVVKVAAGDAFDVRSSDTCGQAVLSRLKGYEAASTTLIRMGFVAGQWIEGEQLASWKKALAKLSLRQANSGNTLWLDLQRYPATLLLYAFGLGAVSNDQWCTLSVLLNVPVLGEQREDKRVVEMVPIWALFQMGSDVMKVLPGRERQYTPLNNHLEELLWKLLGASFPSQMAFQIAFDRLEVLFALSYAIPCIQKEERYWTLPGAYGWRRANMMRIFAEIRSSLESLGDTSLLVSSGLVGSTAVQGLENLNQLEQFVPQFRWH